MHAAPLCPVCKQIPLTPPIRSHIANLHGEDDLAWAPGRGAQQPGLGVVLVQQLDSLSHRHIPEAGVEDGTLHQVVPVLAALLGSLQTGQGPALQNRVKALCSKKLQHRHKAYWKGGRL